MTVSESVADPRFLNRYQNRYQNSGFCGIRIDDERHRESYGNHGISGSFREYLSRTFIVLRNRGLQVRLLLSAVSLSSALPRTSDSNLAGVSPEIGGSDCPHFGRKRPSAIHRRVGTHVGSGSLGFEPRLSLHPFNTPKEMRGKLCVIHQIQQATFIRIITIVLRIYALLFVYDASTSGHTERRECR